LTFPSRRLPPKLKTADFRFAVTLGYEHALRILPR
jgi:hypothetical protein